jgi:ribosome-binding protein aMBF1 (putative translation factor)|tara:strand:- start:1098 stop:1559 length:462 start_codon:yes stop_codon:yes gene_type:complete
MAGVNSLNLAPVFLADNNGQPAWALLPFDQYQHLLRAAGVTDADLGTDKATAIEPSVTAHATSVPAPNATAQLVASLAEHAKNNDALAQLSFDAPKFKSKRQSSSMSVEDLARSVGISPSYTSMIENGERQPSAAIINNFARALGVEKDALMS